MARITCAWEFGGGLGHVRRLLPIASELKARGHEVVFAFRETVLLEGPRARGFEVFAAPRLTPSPERERQPVNFSDILLTQGYDDAPGLKGAVRAWRTLFGHLSPDLLVADYAPTALLAARASGAKRVTVGSGFALPPGGEPDPALRPWEGIGEATLAAVDARLAASMRAALGSDAPARPAAIFEADEHLLCTFPDLDPFGERSAPSYVGPVGEDAAGREAAWALEARPRAFAYLNANDARLPHLVAALARLAGEAIVVAPGVRDATHGCVRLMGEPVRLEGLLEGADLCISHGSPGVGARAMTAGVPLAMLPMQLEHFLIARRLQAAGSGAIFEHDAPATGIEAWLAAMLQREDLRAAARERSRSFEGYSFADAAAALATRIERLAGA